MRFLPFRSGTRITRPIQISDWSLILFFLLIASVDVSNFKLVSSRHRFILVILRHTKLDKFPSNVSRLSIVSNFPMTLENISDEAAIPLMYSKIRLRMPSYTVSFKRAMKPGLIDIDISVSFSSTSYCLHVTLFISIKISFRNPKIMTS